jgi:hypothetical protein
MDPWFFQDPARLQRERAELTALQAERSWLIGHAWKLIDSGLIVEAVIRAHGHDYEVRVTFPMLFPDAPADVHPLNAQTRLSSHQYGGVDGPLCLQWGADNWHRDVTAADLLKSAYELFDTENPLGRLPGQESVVAPSRHQLSVGQELRRKWARWVSTASFLDYARGLDRSAICSFRFSFRSSTKDLWIALIHEVRNSAGDTWSESTIPNTLPGAGRADWFAGALFSVTSTTTEINSLATLSDLTALLPTDAPQHLLALDGSSPIEGMRRWLGGALVRDSNEELHLFAFLEDGTLIRCANVVSTNGAVRTPDSAVFRDKAVGIAGLGSAGSKIAISLARMGARRFYLVDHDVMLPENLERHALDWQSVGVHKAEAVAQTLRGMAATVDVEFSHLHLTGQESTAAVSGALARLASCDVLIDATGNSRAFNVIGAIARAAERPMIWLEIFGGGLGGVLARSRPALDPSAVEMRAVYLRYCRDHPAPENLRNAVRYELNDGGKQPLVAADADVAIIAHHAANLVGDSLRPAKESRYPNSMYLIGLKRGWVFEAPFDTIPIATGSPVRSGDEPTSEPVAAETREFLSDLLRARSS